MADARLTSIIYVVSDSTGETAERVARAALRQYPQHAPSLRVVRRVRSEEELADLVERAAEERALLMFTLVRPELRSFLLAAAHRLQVEVLDVLGQPIAYIGAFLGTTPVNIPTAEMPLSPAYFRRVEAIEFAVKSDDGKEPRNLTRADLVLVGVSRTSKTPVSTYLAGRGLKVANVPIVVGVEPPAELELVDPRKVVALTIEATELVNIRRQRLQQLGMPADANYGLRDHVESELAYADGLFRAHPQWMVIDITHCAVEETATIILEAIKDRDENAGHTLPPSPPR